MKCPKCGENIENGAKFCTKCGVNIEQALEERVKAEAEAKAKAEEEAKLKAEAQAKEAKDEEKVEEIKSEEVKTEVVESTETKSTQKEEKKFDKKEAKPKKKHTGIKVIFIVIIILLLLAAGTYGLYKAEILPESVNDAVLPIFETVEEWFGIEAEDEKDERKEDNKKKNEENKVENKVEKSDKKEVKKIDEEEDLVYDGFTIEINGVKSAIPVINLDYYNIKNINDILENAAKEKLKEAAKSEESYGLVEANYNWYKNDDVISLVFELKYGTGINEYYVYNVNAKDGKEVTNFDILEMAKIDESAFAGKCQTAVIDYFDKLYDDKNDPTIDLEAYTSAKTKTTDKYNFSAYITPMFLNARGELNIVAEITTLAGSGIEKRTINIENLKKNTVETKPVSGDVSNSVSEKDTNVVSNTFEEKDNTVSNKEKGNTTNTTL